MDIATRRRQVLLVCGLLAAAISWATDITAAATRTGYDAVLQSASVLTVPGAPSRLPVVGMQLVANGLVVAFAFGLWSTGGGKRIPRLIAALVTVSAVLQTIAVVWFPFIPGRPAGDAANSLNVALMAPSIAGWFLAIALAAFSQPTWLRLFSIALLLALLVEDLLATAGAAWLVPGAHAGSLVGLQERATGYGFWAWIALVAWACLLGTRRGVVEGGRKPGSVPFSRRRPSI